MAASEYGPEFAQSPTFWGLTSKAHDDATLFSLCRAYDGNNQSLNLRNLLDTIAANMHMFDVEAFRERLKEGAQDRAAQELIQRFSAAGG